MKIFPAGKRLVNYHDMYYFIQLQLFIEVYSCLQFSVKMELCTSCMKEYLERSNSTCPLCRHPFDTREHMQELSCQPIPSGTMDASLERFHQAENGLRSSLDEIRSTILEMVQQFPASAEPTPTPDTMRVVILSQPSGLPLPEWREDLHRELGRPNAGPRWSVMLERIFASDINGTQDIN